MSVAESGREKVDEFLKSGIEVWEREDRITPQQAEALVQSLNTPEVEHGLMHAGAHFAISIPLRFPFGAAARFLYTLGLRLQAELMGIRHRQRPIESRRTHTLLVMLIALLPGFGRAAYFFSPALASHRMLLVIPFDQLSRKLPGRSYDRFHLDALFLYWAQAPVPSGGADVAAEPFWRRLISQLKDLGPYSRWLALTVGVDAALFLVGAKLYFDSDRISTWWFGERSVIASLDVIQLLVAAAAGISAYNLFWRYPRTATRAEAAGIFLWGIGGIGLVLFAIDDYFTIHENVGDFLYASFTFLPRFANNVDDLLVLTYAAAGVAVLVIFRMELRARRPSTTLLYLAAGTSIVMVLCDAFAKSLTLEALELPAQTLAVTFLMFAFIARYREVKQVVPASGDGRSAAVLR
jgi:hypothetical protein